MLEPGDLNGEASAPSQSGHALIGLDAQDLPAGGEEESGDLTGSATDVHCGAGRSVGQPVDQTRRIRRPVTVVALGVGAEALSSDSVLVEG